MNRQSAIPLSFITKENLAPLALLPREKELHVEEGGRELASSRRWQQRFILLTTSSTTNSKTSTRPLHEKGLGCIGVAFVMSRGIIARTASLLQIVDLRVE